MTYCPSCGHAVSDASRNGANGDDPRLLDLLCKACPERAVTLAWLTSDETYDLLRDFLVTNNISRPEMAPHNALHILSALHDATAGQS